MASAAVNGFDPNAEAGEVDGDLGGIDAVLHGLLEDLTELDAFDLVGNDFSGAGRQRPGKVRVAEHIRRTSLGREPLPRAWRAVEDMPGNAAGSSSHRKDGRGSVEKASRRPTPLPFDPVGKTYYTAEEIHALFEGLPPPREDDRTVLAAHPDQPATREELLDFVEEMWALHRAERENAG